MPEFDPNPDDTLLLPAIQNVANADNLVEYRVEALSPGSPMAWQAEGGKAIIYRLYRESDQSQWALKKFKHAFRTPAVLEASRRLSDLVALPGLKAATRFVITSQDAIVRQFPDLEWAVLMPWISGQTCYDMFVEKSKNKSRYSQDDVLTKSHDVVTILSGLEREGYVHTDISNGNLILASNGHSASQHEAHHHTHTQLIDLEDIWRNGAVVKTHYTPGYGHPSLKHGATTACPEGDRYATTILTAEILLLAEPDMAKKFTADGYFRGDLTDTEARERYEIAQQRLKRFCPDFADALAQAWNSRTLADCCPIADLLPTLKGQPSRSIIWLPGTVELDYPSETRGQLSGLKLPYGETVTVVSPEWARVEIAGEQIFLVARPNSLANDKPIFLDSSGGQRYGIRYNVIDRRPPEKPVHPIFAPKVLNDPVSVQTPTFTAPPQPSYSNGGPQSIPILEHEADFEDTSGTDSPIFDDHKPAPSPAENAARPRFAPVPASPSQASSSGGKQLLYIVLVLVVAAFLAMIFRK